MPKLQKEEQVILPDFQVIVEKLEEVLKLTSIPRLMTAWGAIKVEALRRKNLFEDMETVRKAIEARIKKTLVIPDDKNESEKIEMKGIGTVQKVIKPSLKVNNWTGLMEWCVNNNWTDIIQKRQGQTAVVALEQALIDDIELTLPEDLAEFNSFPQLAINKSTKLT